MRGLPQSSSVAGSAHPCALPRSQSRRSSLAAVQKRPRLVSGHRPAWSVHVLPPCWFGGEVGSGFRFNKGTASRNFHSGKRSPCTGAALDRLVSRLHYRPYKSARFIGTKRMDFGTIIREARTSSGLSQAALALCCRPVCSGMRIDKSGRRRSRKQRCERRGHLLLQDRLNSTHNLLPLIGFDHELVMHLADELCLPGQLFVEPVADANGCFNSDLRSCPLDDMSARFLAYFWPGSQLNRYTRPPTVETALLRLASSCAAASARQLGRSAGSRR